MAKPASITTGRIVAQYVVGVVDGADADDEPDFIPAQGSITFETTVGYIPFPVVSGPNPITVLKTRITGILDDEGYLCAPDPGDKTKPGARGLRLVSTDNEVASVQGWTWIATPRFVDVNGSRLDNAIPPFPFHLPAQGPEDPPLDLATVVKVPASVGIGTVQAVALAASAQAAAVSAEASLQGVLDAGLANDEGVAAFLTDGPRTSAALTAVVETKIAESGGGNAGITPDPDNPGLYLIGA